MLHVHFDPWGKGGGPQISTAPTLAAAWQLITQRFPQAARAAGWDMARPAGTDRWQFATLRVWADGADREDWLAALIVNDSPAPPRAGSAAVLRGPHGCRPGCGQAGDVGIRLAASP
jgi:hypothetical protein